MNRRLSAVANFALRVRIAAVGEFGKQNDAQ